MRQMTEPADWSRAADSKRRIGHAVEFHAEIPSTNDRARAALHEPGGEGLAVVADLQTAGRGRRGRTWLSPPGVNLMASIPIRPNLAADAAGLLGIAAALATCSACEQSVPDANLAINWPNDVVAEQYKVAGLLIETATEGESFSEAIFGVGINVNWKWRDMPKELWGRATSLADLAGREIDRVTLLGNLLAALDEEVAAVERGESPLDRFRARDALKGHLLEVDLGGGNFMLGNASGIADTGSLILTTSAGEFEVSAGEVVHVGSPLAGATS